MRVELHVLLGGELLDVAEGLLHEAFHLALLQLTLLPIDVRSVPGACPVIHALAVHAAIIRALPGCLLGRLWRVHSSIAGLIMRLEGDVAQQDVDLLRSNHVVPIEVVPKDSMNFVISILTRSLFIPLKIQWHQDNLHLEGETHLGLDAAGEDLQHEVDEALLEDAPVGLALARQGVEAVRDNAWEVDVLDEGHLVD